MILLKDLQPELMIHILSYLRAVDLAYVREVDKTVFNERTVNDAIDCLCKEVYNFIPSSLTTKSSCKFKRPDYLHLQEINYILFSLMSAQPAAGKGFWVSSSWVSQAKKYFNGLLLCQTERNTFKKKKLSKAKQNKISGLLKPSLFINADIVCTHGLLSLPNVPKTKRRSIGSRYWYFLRRFFPDGQQFKCNSSIDCTFCCANNYDAKASAVEKREIQIMERRSDLIPRCLEALSARRSGVPMHCLAERVRLFEDCSIVVGDINICNTSNYSTATIAAPPRISNDDDDGIYESLYDFPEYKDLRDNSDRTDSTTISSELMQPLIPGLYNLIPRKWLQQWRRYTKDARLQTLPHLDCSSLLCHSHGLLVIPPHVQEYLLGLRRTLLGGLSQYTLPQGATSSTAETAADVAVEIVSAEEWDELQNVLHSLCGAADFNVRLCIDNDFEMTWNVGVCSVCDPYNYCSFLSHTMNKRSHNAQNIVGMVMP